MTRVLPEVREEIKLANPNEGLPYLSEELKPASYYRFLPVWKRAVFKIKVQGAIRVIGEELMVFGTSNEVGGGQADQVDIEKFFLRKAKRRESLRELTTTGETLKHRWYLLHPDSISKKLWNSLLTLLLIYTALLMPYRLAFEEQVFWDSWAILDVAIDGAFLLDICINFFSVQVKADGSLEKRHRSIICSYVKGWFVVDLVSSFPITVVDYYTGGDSGLPKDKYNSMIRLARLPRLYKLLRIVRILKVLKHYSNSRVFIALQDCLQINSRLWKLVKFLMSVMLCVHIVGCLWFFTARIVDFDVTCWVVRMNALDSSNMHQYLLSIYWAITTAATVGYGDIVPFSQVEVMFAMAWMITGVGFYSYTVGSLSSFLTSVDTRDSVLSMKLAAVTEFAKETGISSDIRNRLRDAVKYNSYRMGNVWSDRHSLFTELPKSLKQEVVWSVYEGAVKEFAVFSLFDSSFVSALVPLMVTMRCIEGDYLYHVGDYPDEVFFILNGRVNYVIEPSEISYKSFLRGSYIGEIEILQRVNRINSSLCFGICELLVLSKSDLSRVLADFPAEAKEFRRLAFERASRNKQAYLETMELLKMRVKLGSLGGLAGRDRILSVEQELDNEVPLGDQFKVRLKALQKESQTHLTGLFELSHKISNTLQLLTRLLEVTESPPFVPVNVVPEASSEEETIVS